MAIIHGFAENSDIHLESAIQYALNGFDVHLIDLRGYGLGGGYRMINNKIHDYHYDVSALLRQVNPNLPLFIYGHSMGGLTLATYLLNNTGLNIAGVVLSAPLLYFSDTKPVPESKKHMVKALAPHLEEFIVNPGMPIHMICNDKFVFKEFLHNKKTMPFMSFKLIASMMEYFDDVPLNTKGFKYPLLLMMAEHE